VKDLVGKRGRGLIRRQKREHEPERAGAKPWEGAEIGLELMLAAEVVCETNAVGGEGNMKHPNCMTVGEHWTTRKRDRRRPKGNRPKGVLDGGTCPHRSK